MKMIMLLSFVLMLLGYSNNTLVAQETSITTDKYTTASFIVAGNCEHCKIRIEAAARAARAKKASWDAETQKLTVSFDPQVTSVAKIEEKIAAAGHDTESLKASNKKYKTLPACCKYDRTEEVKKEPQK